MKTRKSYTIKFKLESIKYAQQTDPKSAATKYRVDKKCILDWLKDQNRLQNCSLPQNKRRVLFKRRAKFYKVEEELFEWCLFQRECEVPLTTKTIIVKACQLDPTMNELSIAKLQKWVYRFMERHKLTFRKPTHVGPRLPDNYQDKVNCFLKHIISLRAQNDFPYALIANMDETPIFFNMPSTTTIDQIGKKEILCKTFNQENVRVSLCLCVCADGTKIPPLIIFKGISTSTNKKMLKLPMVAAGQIHVLTQEKAWNDERCMKYWIQNIWNPYTKNRKSLLVLDDARSHNTKEVRQILYDMNTSIAMIPGGLTTKLQPCDQCLNKIIKSSLKEIYSQHLIEHPESEKISKEQLVVWINHIWNIDQKLVHPQMIQNSFKCTGISNSLDGSEDNCFGDDAEKLSRKRKKKKGESKDVDKCIIDFLNDENDK